jgi:hypothetical protein
MEQAIDAIEGVREVIREQNREIIELKALIRAMGGGARLEKLYEPKEVCDETSAK